MPVEDYPSFTLPMKREQDGNSMPSPFPMKVGFGKRTSLNTKNKGDEARESSVALSSCFLAQQIYEKNRFVIIFFNQNLLF
jgi:hypothetical protein